ncbi:MAG: NAD(+) synthase [Thermoanaerobaculia bacterium]
MNEATRDFCSIDTQGFLRLAVAVPRVAVANPQANLQRTLELARRAGAEGAAVVLFPELGLSGYAIGDLVHQGALEGAVEAALEDLIAASADLPSVLLAGAPLLFEGRLFNCGAVVYRGRLVGLVPKSYLPNYREFYEARHFTPAEGASFSSVRFHGREVPFGPRLLFTASSRPAFVLHVEICEDFWVPVPPSSLAALAGATVLANLSASNVTVAKADYRRLLCSAQSGRTVAAYLYAAAGYGESTTDLAWDGHALIHENGTLLAETERFADHDQLAVADIDLERLAAERLRMNSFWENGRTVKPLIEEFRRVELDFEPPRAPGPLRRHLERFPYVPADPARRDERCLEVYEIQVQGLRRRLEAVGLERVVIGVSGGLDSTQALLVAVQTLDRMGLPRSHVLAYTLPGFATSERTYRDAWRLMKALGVSAAEIDIRPSARQMLADIGHPAAQGAAQYDAAYENVQAGERTSHLFRLANLHRALVVGTGDLSELALGWCTYGVGDHMSHYGVNASVPKTLIRHLIRWQVESGRVDAATAEVLSSILATPVSPELVPGTVGGEPAQRTEDEIGPYELQDFHLYYLSRFGFRPSKVAFLAWSAWKDREAGSWPPDLPEGERRAYDLTTIKRWLRVFVERFIATSQFKRSALPDGPKVGSGGSLSPRGDWRAPSDADASAWLAELESNVPEEEPR